MTIIIVICIILGVYVVSAIIGSKLLYELYMESAEAIEYFSPELYKYSSIRTFRESTKINRIKEAVLVSFSPIHCFPSLKVLLFNRNELQTEFVGVQVELAKERKKMIEEIIEEHPMEVMTFATLAKMLEEE